MNAISDGEGSREQRREKEREMHEEIKMRKERQNYKIKNGQNSSLFQPVWKKAGAFPLRREKIQRLEWRIGKEEAREKMKMMMERRQELQLEGERRWEDYKSIMLSVPQYQDRKLLSLSETGSSEVGSGVRLLWDCLLPQG